MTFSSWYFGMDGNSSTPFPCAGNGSHYYIGRLGGETTAGGTGFNTATAQAVGASLVSSYWDVAGPGSAGSLTPYNWGVAQANAFIAAWNANVNVSGSTLFGDFEGLNGGWGTGNQTNNRAVLHGFLYTIAQHGLTPGVYITLSNWDSYFGSTFTSPDPFVFWLADAYCGTTCAQAESTFNSTISTSTYNRGGYKVMIWQYVISSCAGSNGNDLNITPYTGYQNGHWNPTVA